MNKEILVDANGFSTRVAVVEDGSPVELYVEQEGTQRLVGNIYNGRVQNVLPGMQAAFIDIGLERNAFLYAGDIVMPDGTDGDFEKEKIQSMRNIRDMLKPGQTIMVQVAKDPVGTKGARVTTHITLAGRSLVLMPTMDYVGVSRRIEKDEERVRLRKILCDIKPDNMGVIVRTASAGKSREAFSEDLESLMLLYAEIQKKAKKQKAPALLHAEQSLLFRTVRDLLMKDVDRVFVNDPATYDSLREIADVMAPKLKPRILSKPSENLFDRYETESKIDKALARKVWIKNGSYIIIDRTEALTCIDVNTGKFVGKDNLEKTITATNCEAAREIARQLRLRDIGGIIIIDFIDMESPEHQQQVVDALRDALKRDRNKTNVVGLTGLGLVEMTRKKMRSKLSERMEKTCPCCGGTGRVMQEEHTARRALRDAARILSSGAKEGIVLSANEEVLDCVRQLAPEGIYLKPDNRKRSGDYHVSTEPESECEGLERT